MLTTDTLRQFFGWATVLNMGMLIFSSIMLAVLRGKITKLQSRLFGLGEKELTLAAYQYLANYKVLVLVFNAVPYLALKIMSCARCAALN